MRKFFLMFFCLMLETMLFSNAQAQHVTFGVPSCITWIRDAGTQRGALNIGWLHGYLSGLNLMWNETGQTPKNPLSKFTSSAETVTFVDSFCKANINKYVSDGAIAIFLHAAK
ncbi:hypothetical protein [Zwartia sp.]|uniref:hypothetical protein n=1 Tax=Zwartia sp. TaxID=2978004 RepID=UPI0027267B5C|nr:hypothetical protein [Zwartia sp.]MDO9025300.1 hypothetical protein [Zwartia sp.]